MLLLPVALVLIQTEESFQFRGLLCQELLVEKFFLLKRVLLLPPWMNIVFMNRLSFFEGGDYVMSYVKYGGIY